MEVQAPCITGAMKIAAATALAEHVKEPNKDHISPSVLDKSAGEAVARAVAEAYRKAPDGEIGKNANRYRALPRTESAFCSESDRKDCVVK